MVHNIVNNSEFLILNNNFLKRKSVQSLRDSNRLVLAEWHLKKLFWVSLMRNES